MDIQKKQIWVNMPVAKFEVSVIADSDAIVSDSKPDLLKIIQIDPAVRINKCDVLNGKMITGGSVTYQILYQPENAEGVCSMSATADFSQMEENPLFEEGMYADLHAHTEHTEWELINSRKIRLKSVIGLNANVTCRKSVTLPLDIPGDNIRVKYGDFTGFERLLNKRDTITVSDALPLQPGKPNIGSLLKSDATLLNKDIKIISGKVIIKGDLEVNNLYIPEGTNSVDFCSHTIPFTEILDADGISETDVCNVKTAIEKCDFSLMPDSDGDIRVINTTICIGVRICADTPITERVITDVYSLTDNLQTNYIPLQCKKTLADINTSHTVKSSIGCAGASAVYSLTAKPEVTNVIPGENSAVIEGYIDTGALCILQGQICPVILRREEIPFKIMVDMPDCHSDANVECEVEAYDVSCILNPGGDLDVRIILSCRATASRMDVIEITDKIESDGPVCSRTPSIVLYFVQKNDTLWDIAKRYHTKSEYISELNGDAANDLKCGSQLLIPRG